MSIVTGTKGLKVQLNDGLHTGELLGSTPQAEQAISISGASAQGSVPTLTTLPSLAGGWGTFTWNSVQLCMAFNHGAGLQWAFTFTDSGGVITWFPPVTFAPTEQGSQADGSQLNICSSRNRYRGKVGTNRAIRVVNAAQWLPPGRQSAPIAINKTILCDAPALTDTEFGFLGSPNIIRNTMVISVPVDATWQSMLHSLNCPWVFFGLFSIFTVFEKLNVNAGTYSTVVPSPFDLNSVDPYVMSSADGTVAICMYMPVSAIGASGIYVIQTDSATWTSVNAQVGQEYPSGVPAGDITYVSYMVFASRANLPAIMQTLKASVG